MNTAYTASPLLVFLPVLFLALLVLGLSLPVVAGITAFAILAVKKTDKVS